MCCAEQFHDYLWLSQTCETCLSHGVQAYLDMYLRPTHNLKCCLFGDYYAYCSIKGAVSRTAGSLFRYQRPQEDLTSEENLRSSQKD